MSTEDDRMAAPVTDGPAQPPAAPEEDGTDHDRLAFNNAVVVGQAPVDFGPEEHPEVGECGCATHLAHAECAPACQMFMGCGGA